MPVLKMPFDKYQKAIERAVEFGNRRGPRGERMQRAERFLERVERLGILTIHGVEFAECAGNEMAYINMGDTYDLTVCQEGDGKLFASSWGDWHQETESEHCQETDTIRCGYCGEFTPLCDKALAQPEGARHAWRETVCEHCGKNVAG